MSTSCMIFKKKRSWGHTQETGYLGIYCHWNGYPKSVGQMLKKHYRTDEKIDRLIALGDISELREKIGTKHDFRDGPKDETIAYHRDRNELWSKVKPVFVKTIQETRNVCGGCDYVYIYEKNKWTCFKRTYFKK